MNSHLPKSCGASIAFGKDWTRNRTGTFSSLFTKTQAAKKPGTTSGLPYNGQSKLSRKGGGVCCWSWLPAPARRSPSFRSYGDCGKRTRSDGCFSSWRGFDGLTSRFTRLVLKSPYFVSYANSSTHGMNLPRLGKEKALQALFPLPPLAEQHRIIAKVDELMGLIDRLENHVVTKNRYQETAATAAVHPV